MERAAERMGSLKNRDGYRGRSGSVSGDRRVGVGRKRNKRGQAEDVEDAEEEARKKARGRPRVDTHDETAADASLSTIHPDWSRMLMLSRGDELKSGWLKERIGLGRRVPSLR
jgi:hypothetical protein